MGTKSNCAIKHNKPVYTVAKAIGGDTPGVPGSKAESVPVQYLRYHQRIEPPSRGENGEK